MTERGHWRLLKTRTSPGPLAGSSIKHDDQFSAISPSVDDRKTTRDPLNLIRVRLAIDDFRSLEDISWMKTQHNTLLVSRMSCLSLEVTSLAVWSRCSSICPGYLFDKKSDVSITSHRRLLTSSHLMFDTKHSPLHFLSEVDITLLPLFFFFFFLLSLLSNPHILLPYLIS